MRSPLLFLLIESFLLHDVAAFAYAPNFITKIVEQQTGIEPTGLLRIEDNVDDGATVDATVNTNGQQQPAAVMDRQDQLVTTRFPPEPNGYLHLGHAKAVCFNFAVARMFGGNCHMRLDDTNPTKESVEYVQSILEDVRWIQSGINTGKPLSDTATPWNGPVRKTSDSFDLIYKAATALIESGDAYVDSLTAEEMREYRGSLTEPGKESPYKTARTVEEHLELFREMKEGKHAEGTHVLRANIDMASSNMNMRDPTLYRIKHESHQETGDKWCIYPMYDFSHPIADAVEGITHSLCTLEFEDHRPFYDWVLQKLTPTGLIPSSSSLGQGAVFPQQIEFSRLNIQSTVLSKRKLIQLVEAGVVSGWDDPRMPTLSGIRRRGAPSSALRLFCERVGISKTDSNIDLTVLEDCMRETMDATSPRAFCVLRPLKVTLTNWDDSMAHETFEVDRHPKLQEMGKRSIPFSKTIYIERDDFFDAEGPEGKASDGKPPKGFKRLLPSGRVRLRYAYVIECQEIIRDPTTQEPVELRCTYYPETRAGVTPEGMSRVKGIVHWVDANAAVSCQINQYDRLFSTKEPGKESGDYLKDINPESLKIVEGAVIEPSVAEDAAIILDQIQQQESSDGDNSKIYASQLAYQFERSGYFALDEASTNKDGFVFNRVVTLRDTWGVDKKGKKGGGQQQRSRGQQKQQNKNQVVEDIRRVAFTAATILSAAPHPEADSLVVCQVNCGGEGEEPRTVVAGLAGKIPLEELVGQKVVAVTNLKPAKMRGLESTAMLLAASDGKEGDEETVELLIVPDSVPPGETIFLEGKEPSQPDVMMKSKGAVKAWERAKAGLRANAVGEAIYEDDKKQEFRLMTSAGPVKTSTLTESDIR